MSLKVSQLLFYSSTQHVVIFTLSYTSSEIYIYSVYNDNTLWNNILFCTLFCFIIFCKKKVWICHFQDFITRTRLLNCYFCTNGEKHELKKMNILCEIEECMFSTSCSTSLAFNHLFFILTCTSLVSLLKRFIITNRKCVYLFATFYIYVFAWYKVLG